MLKKILFAVFPLYILTACQQDISEILAEAADCRISTGIYYGGSGGINDSAAFTYQNGRISMVESRYIRVEYFYADTNIRVRKFYEKPVNELVGTDTVDYNSNGRIAKIIHWTYPGMGFSDTVVDIMHFSYQGNLPSQILEEYAYYGEPFDTALYILLADAAGNISKINMADASGTVYDSTLYQFDTNPNYFKIAHPDFFLLDPFFELQVGLVAHFPYFYSKNNVTDFNVYGSFGNPIVYGVDSLNQLTSVDMGGFEYMKYRYICP